MAHKIIKQSNPLPTSSIPSETPINPPISASSLNKSILIIILVILFMVLFSLVVYLFVKSQTSFQKPTIPPAPSVQVTPTPNPMANWKIYTSDQLKFIIKYPNDWFFSVDTLTSFDREIAKGGNLPKEPFQTCHFIPYDPPLFNVLSETIIQNSQPQIVKQRVIDKSIQPQLDKNAFTIYSIKQNGFSTVEVTCIDQSGIYDAKIDQILSTFKFTNINASSANANWKTYTNTSFGFSVNYPSDYFTFKDPLVDFSVATNAPQGGNGIKFSAPKDIWLDILVSKNTTNTTLDAYLAQLNTSSINKTPATIGGIAGDKLSYTMQVFCAGTTCTPEYLSEGLVLHNGNIYQIEMYSLDKSSLDTNSAMFDQVLSTFKFTQ